MARIRTIKPEFFRHEGLQDCEAENPGSYVMLVFAGLWGHCDKAGRFEWRPRQLKLDILPFLNFDMGKTLALLERIGVLFQYEVDGVKYGCIPSLAEHQRFSGKEAQEPEKHPAPPVKQRGSIGEFSSGGVAGSASGAVIEAAHPPMPGVNRLTLCDDEKQSKSAKNDAGSNGEAMGKHLPAQEREGNGIREEEGKGSKNSEAKASGADAPLAADPPKPIDLQKLVWDTGVKFLQYNGQNERNARSLLGKWVKTHGPPAVLDALRRAEVAASPEPVSYITKVLENGRKTGFTSVEDAFAGLEVRAASAVERASGAGWREGGYVDPSSDVWPAEEDARGGGDLVRAVG